MIRTLVCAASGFVRESLADVVRGDARLHLAGSASPDDLDRRIRALEPDVVLEERERDGEALAVPSVALVDDPRLAWSRDFRFAGERGARAILARDALAEEIVAAIVAVAAGLVAVQPRTLYRTDGAAALAPPPARPSEAERLTAREIDVLGELARGVPNKAIAARLRISEHTVKFHVAAIFAKLGVSSRTEAVTSGVRLGLIML